MGGFCCCFILGFDIVVVVVLWLLFNFVVVLFGLLLLCSFVGVGCCCFPLGGVVVWGRGGGVGVGLFVFSKVGANVCLTFSRICLAPKQLYGETYAYIYCCK